MNLAFQLYGAPLDGLIARSDHCNHDHSDTIHAEVFREAVEAGGARRLLRLRGSRCLAIRAPALWWASLISVLFRVGYDPVDLRRCSSARSTAGFDQFRGLLLQLDPT